MIQIKDIYAGKPDAKDEIASEGYQPFLDSYIRPIQLDLNALVDGSFYFISGFKGTGKTALLYYLEDYVKERDKLSCVSYIFFKEDYSDNNKQEMEALSKRLVSSISIGNDVVLDGNDFEYIWRWLFYQRIWEDNIDCHYGLFARDEAWIQFDKIINKISSISHKRRWGIPRRLKVGIPIHLPALSIEPNAEVDFTQPNVDKSEPYRKFVEHIIALDEIFLKLVRTDVPYYLFVDELEAYCGDKQVFERDLRLIRDLVFTVKKLNITMATNWSKTKIICSIRKEIINSIYRFVVTKELNKVTSGFEIPLVWNYTNTNSFEHPIMKILIKRIMLSERLKGNEVSERDIILSWFPEKIDGVDPANYILNYGWNKPRDIVRLILIAKSCLCSESSAFNQATFDMLKKGYSKESLIEIREEMRALYSETDIDSIINCLTGFRVIFTKENLEERIKRFYPNSIWSKKMDEILIDLYRLGVIGNYSPLSKSHRWQHKGDDQLILSDDWRIMIHPALQSALSVSSRHDNGINRKEQLPKQGEIFTVSVSWQNDVVLGVQFTKKEKIYDGVLYKKFLSSKALSYKVGDKFLAQVLGYNPSHKNWTLIEKR